MVLKFCQPAEHKTVVAAEKDPDDGSDSDDDQDDDQPFQEVTEGASDVEHKCEDAENN